MLLCSIELVGKQIYGIDLLRSYSLQQQAIQRASGEFLVAKKGGEPQEKGKE
jgi:hypothetical protein